MAAPFSADYGRASLMLPYGEIWRMISNPTSNVVTAMRMKECYQPELASDNPTQREQVARVVTIYPQRIFLL